MINKPELFVAKIDGRWSTTEEGINIIRREAFNRASDATYITDAEFATIVRGQFEKLSNEWDNTVINYVGG
jgi:hypothetical protein